MKKYLATFYINFKRKSEKKGVKYRKSKRGKKKCEKGIYC